MGPGIARWVLRYWHDYQAQQLSPWKNYLQDPGGDLLLQTPFEAPGRLSDYGIHLRDKPVLHVVLEVFRIFSLCAAVNPGDSPDAGGVFYG